MNRGSGWVAGELELLNLVGQAARGPRRNGIFALWLTVRVAAHTPLDGPGKGRVRGRARRRRVEALEARLSSLSLAPPLRRALRATLAQLDQGTAEAAAGALKQLVAPARECAGPGAGAAVARAAEVAGRLAQAAIRRHDP